MMQSGVEDPRSLYSQKTLEKPGMLNTQAGLFNNECVCGGGMLMCVFHPESWEWVLLIAY